MSVKSPEIIDPSPQGEPYDAQQNKIEKAVDLNPVAVTTIEVENVTLETADHSEISITEISIESHEISEVKSEPEAKPEVSANLNPQKISALSLASIRAKKELAENSKIVIKDEIHLTEEFTETDMLLQWNKYAQRLADKGHKIMESLLLINDPKLEGTTIIHELPNEGSKIDFESEKHELVGYLRGKLHNHDIDIRIIVNESMDSRKAFTPQDRYNRLNEINPSLELLRKTFDLDI
ncbi:MAG TPA: hypothetical protein VK623_02515 [Flavobacterium sp.]|nr:hypothetical protein [Flavobacterium sp.]